MVAPSSTPSLASPSPADVASAATPGPDAATPGPDADAAAAALASALLLLSLASVVFILHFQLRASRRTAPRIRLLRLRDLNSLWAVRILLAAFASLWSLAELLRLPAVRRDLLGGNPLPGKTPHAPGGLHLDSCSAYVLATQGFAEPCFFATLLFLLRISVQGKASYPNAFATALGLSLLASLPFLLSHALFLAFSPWVLSRLGIPPEVFFSEGTVGFADGSRCSYPLFSTALLGCFGAVYVPWFISACWRAVAVVINKRLRVRLYTLTATVVVGISVQVAALAVSAFWSPGDAAFEGLALAAFLGVFFSAVVGEGVLVLYPIADALDAVGWKPPAPLVPATATATATAAATAAAAGGLVVV